MYAFFESILRVTAWPMTPPAPYSAFHILLTLFGAGLAVFFARIFRKKIRSTSAPEPYFRRILFSCGECVWWQAAEKDGFMIRYHGWCFYSAYLWYGSTLILWICFPVGRGMWYGVLRTGSKISCRWDWDKSPFLAFSCCPPTCFSGIFLGRSWPENGRAGYSVFWSLM